MFEAMNRGERLTRMAGFLAIASGLGWVLTTAGRVEAAPAKTIHVDAARGSDRLGNGAPGRPYKTITRGLRGALSGQTVVAELGRYDKANGETFPLRMKRGVSLLGATRPRRAGGFPFVDSVAGPDGAFYTSPIIAGCAEVEIPYGDGSTTTRFVAVMGADDATLANFVIFAAGETELPNTGTGVLCESSSPTIRDNQFRGPREHEGIMVLGDARPEIRSNLFKGVFTWSITVHGTSEPEIADNQLRTWSGIDNTADSRAEILDNLVTCDDTGINTKDRAAPRIQGNTIRGNTYGIFCGQEAAPVVRNNTIEENGDAEFPYLETGGIVIYLDARPDLGGGDGTAGGNVFRGNEDWDVVNNSPNSIWAQGNTWSHSALGPTFIDLLDIWDDDESSNSGVVIFRTIQ